MLPATLRADHCVLFDETWEVSEPLQFGMTAYFAEFPDTSQIDCVTDESDWASSTRLMKCAVVNINPILRDPPAWMPGEV